MSSSSSSSSSSERDDSPKPTPKVVFGVESDSEDEKPKEKTDKKRDAKHKSKNGFKARVVPGDMDSYCNFLNVNIQRQIEKSSKKTEGNVFKIINKMKDEYQVMLEAKKLAAQQLVEQKRNEQSMKVSTMEQQGIYKGSEYKDLVKSTLKEKKQMKLHFRKYEMIKTSLNIQEGKSIIDKCEQYVKEMQAEKGIGCNKYNEPHLVIVVPGIEQVEAVYKQLLKKYKKFSGKSKTDEMYDIRISKLWGKHLKASDYEAILEQKHENRKTKKVLNIYLGAPSRLNILANQKVLKID
jgi:hypothetical protein